MFDVASFASYHIGDEIEVRGACYPPSSQFPVGLFRPGPKPNQWELERVFGVATDAKGSFKTKLKLTDDLLKDGAGGTYLILPATKEMQQDVLSSGSPRMNFLPYAAFTLSPNSSIPIEPHFKIFVPTAGAQTFKLGPTAAATARGIFRPLPPTNR